FTPIPRDNREYSRIFKRFALRIEYHPPLRAYVGLN
ncbi:MAG: hypothetical protein ACI8RD_011105, partial [Bacillariaceae sp.]